MLLVDHCSHGISLHMPVMLCSLSVHVVDSCIHVPDSSNQAAICKQLQVVHLKFSCLETGITLMYKFLFLLCSVVSVIR